MTPNELAARREAEKRLGCDECAAIVGADARTAEEGIR